MKRNRFLSFFLAGLMLFSFLSVFPNDSFSPFTMMEVNAAEGRLYNQNDSYWKTVTFTKYASSGNSMYTSGCGIFSFCNAIYALNGSKISAEELATWAVNNGSYQPGNGGLYRQTFYNNVQSGFGSTYGFKIDGQYYGTISDSRLITHLQNGGVAAIHVSNHFMAVTGYNASNGTYHVIESAVYSGRGLQADSWVTASKLSSGSTDVDWYALISNTVKTGAWYDDLTPVNLGDQFCALVSNASTGGYMQNEGWNVAAYPGDSSNKQSWIFNRQSDNSYVITSTYDTNRLTVYNHEDNNCTSVIVTGDEIDNCQKWYIYQVGSNYIFRPSHSNKVMDLDGCGTAAGTNIQIYEYNGTGPQCFKIEKKAWTNYMVPDNPGYDFCAKVYNNTTGGYLQNEGWNVAAYSGTNDINQIWHFSRQSDGSFIITSVMDGARLMPYNNEANNCTSIIVSHDSVSDYQKWYVYFTNSGYFLRPVYCDKVMDIAGGGYDSGTNVQLYDFNSTYAQYYNIEQCDFSFTLNFDSNGGTCSTSSKTVTYASKYGELPEPIRSGYTFNGWYTAKDGGGIITGDATVSVASIQTLYAHWTANKYTVTFKPTGGTCDSTSKSVTYNSTYGDLPKPTRTGHVFKGWFTAESGGTQITKDSKVTITANQTLYAQWTLNSYTVTLDANGGTVSDDSVTVTYSKGYGTLPEPTKDGYTFLGWFTAADGGTEVTASTAVTTNKDHTLYAHWQKNKVVGDVNTDGAFNVADVVMLQKWLICTPNATLTDWQAADMCDDDIIDVFDLCLMKRELLKKS